MSSRGVNKSLSEIEVALTQVDQQSIFDKHRARVRVEIWDKKTPINGVPAERIFASRTDIPENGEVYLLYIDDRLVYFQPHDPNQSGLVAMTKDSVLAIANQHADQVAEELANEEIFEKVLEQLL
ncbi:MAG: hypothetical protein H5T85_07805 [Actinobacteria bacterium]|nr:hypothetical protein [Actinomycetota bacterium]